MPYPGRTDDGYAEPLTPEPGDVCQCRHTYEQHRGGTGACTQPDSYGLPCECPAIEVYPCCAGRDDEDE